MNKKKRTALIVVIFLLICVLFPAPAIEQSDFSSLNGYESEVSSSLSLFSDKIDIEKFDVNGGLMQIFIRFKKNVNFTEREKIVTEIERNLIESVFSHDSGVTVSFHNGKRDEGWQFQITCVAIKKEYVAFRKIKFITVSHLLTRMPVKGAGYLKPPNVSLFPNNFPSVVLFRKNSPGFSTDNPVNGYDSVGANCVISLYAPEEIIAVLPIHINVSQEARVMRSGGIEDVPVISASGWIIP